MRYDEGASQTQEDHITMFKSIGVSLVTSFVVSLVGLGCASSPDPEPGSEDVQENAAALTCSTSACTTASQCCPAPGKFAYCQSYRLGAPKTCQWF
jgi:hypothetical protein